MARTWLITGASRGLGFHIAQSALAVGDNVIATGRSSLAVAEAFGDCGDQLLALPLDVTRQEQVQQVVNKAIEHFACIDVLVNNAGFGQLGPFEENTPAAAHEQFATNVFGLFDMCRAVLPIMRERKQGHVFNIASIAGLAGMGGAALYCSSKFAVAGFSEALAQEVAGFGIKVTSVAPGAFRTDFLDASSARFGNNQLTDYADQQPIGQQILEAVEAHDKGRINYLWPNPVTRRSEPKVTLFEKTGDYIVAVGFYVKAE